MFFEGSPTAAGPTVGRAQNCPDRKYRFILYFIETLIKATVSE